MVSRLCVLRSQGVKLTSLGAKFRVTVEIFKKNIFFILKYIKIIYNIKKFKNFQKCLLNTKINILLINY